MKLVFLGRYRELGNCGSEDVALPEDVRDLAALRRWLAQSKPVYMPALEGTTAIVINQILVRDPLHPVADNDEVAFLPPMSGG